METKRDRTLSASTYGVCGIGICGVLRSGGLSSVLSAVLPRFRRELAAALLMLGLLLWSTLVPGTLTAAIPPVRIMPLGDSITSGCCTDTDVEGGYRIELYRLLVNAGYNVDFLGTVRDPHPHASLGDPDHEGHGGYFIHHIDAGIERWLGAVGDPDVILLLIGTNDYHNRYDTDHAIDRLDSLIAHLAALRPYAKIIVANLLVRTDLPAVDLAIQTTFNPRVPEIVARQALLGTDVSFLDMRSCCGPGDLASDRLHPSLTGFRKIGQAWFEAVTKVISPFGTADPPAIMRISAEADLSHVVVTLSKPVEDQAAALDNYRLSGGLSILGADLDSSKRVIRLVTSPQTPGAAYTLTVSGIRDRTPQRNMIAPGSAANFRAAMLHRLSLNSSNPGSGVSVSLSPADNNREGNGSTPFSRMYTPGAIVAVAAPQVIGSSPFQKWQKDGADFSTHYSVSVAMDAAHTLTAVYAPAVVPPRSLSIQSVNPGSGVMIQVAPTDVNQSGSGVTPFARNYREGSIVSIAAPQAIGSSRFQKWQKDGADFSTHYSVSLAMEAAHTLTAVYAPAVVATRSLSIQSVNPETGVTVQVAPADVNQSGSGVTPFARSYKEGSIVSVAAPQLVGSSRFQKWQKDGADFSTHYSVGLAMDAAHTLTAVYTPAVVATRSLSIQSVNPGAGVTVQVAPPDVNQSGSGVTPFARNFREGAIVSVAAPQVIGSSRFQKWQKDSADFSTHYSVSLAMDAAHTLTAVYTPAVVPTRSLSIQSANPGAGVMVQLAPADMNQSGNGVTPFVRSYREGAIVSVAAPQTIGSSRFQKWQKDSADFSTHYSVTLAMDAPHTLTAIYAPAVVPTRSLSIQSSNPGAGVTVQVAPPDVNQSANGVTPFARNYREGAIVSVAAPQVIGASRFQKWQKDGVNFSTHYSVSLAMDAGHTLTAVYAPTAAATFYFLQPDQWSEPRGTVLKPMGRVSQ